MTETALDYVSAPVPEDCVFKISPSAFSKFIERPHAWYREEVLQEDVFDYNTSSVLGTAVHYCCEQVARNQDVDLDEIEKYIDKFEAKEDYEPETVRAQYVAMAERIVNDYVLERLPYMHVEEQFCVHVRDNYYVAGTTDAIEGSKEDCMITDYKTYSSKTKPRAIPQHYKYQLLVYAWMLMQSGYNVTRIRLVYVNRHIEGEISEKTGKQMKSYPPEVTVLTDSIDVNDMNFIEGLLQLCVDSLKASEAHPDLRHVIWHDPRLAE